jgi:hypothetical protein
MHKSQKGLGKHYNISKLGFKHKYIKALLLFHSDEITGILKQLKIPTVAPTCFGSRRNRHQGAIFVLS